MKAIDTKQLFGAAVLFLLLVAGCQTSRLSESQRFEASVRKELPFRVDSMRRVSGTDFVTFQFSNQEYISALPDAEIGSKGSLSVYKTFFQEMPTRQSEDKIWRNVVVSRKNQRIICIDRYLKEGKTNGYIYVLQSESEQYPTYGRCHWDVSDSHNIESVGMYLQNLRELAVKRLKGDYTGLYEAPTSQEAYWTLMIHADSLYEELRYDEAKQIYDLAFTEDRYILPSHLSTVANKMRAVDYDQAALEYINHRVLMEKDFYMEPTDCPYPQLKDTFGQRKRIWNYNLPLKEELEGVFERDQYDRILWHQAITRYPQQTRRNDMLAARTVESDSINLIIVNRVLSEGGFPRRSQVGEFATLAVFSVYQHNPLDYQKQFLPQLEEAVSNGEIAPAYLAVLKDRIDIREGRPQKYGSQRDGNGKLCPLLDASRVNEWRQEVGLPPIELK